MTELPYGGTQGEIRTFAAFLAEAGPYKDRVTPEGKKQFTEAWKKHYPEDYARAIADRKAREAAKDEQ